MHTTPAEKKILQQNMLLLLHVTTFLLLILQSALFKRIFLQNPNELSTTGLSVPMNIEITAETLLSAKVRFLEPSVHANKEIDFEVQLIR